MVYLILLAICRQGKGFCMQQTCRNLVICHRDSSHPQVTCSQTGMNFSQFLDAAWLKEVLPIHVCTGSDEQDAFHVASQRVYGDPWTWSLGY